LSVLVILAVFATAVIDSPGLAGAGDIEPPPEAVDGAGNPISTMKTLNHIPPTWSQILPTAERFELVLGGAAVLDKETGLVWEQSPNTSSWAWNNAFNVCLGNTVGGRKGWRLPRVEELASLIDPTQSDPSLPIDYDSFFSNVQPAYYWSSTAYENDANRARAVFLYNGGVGHGDKSYSYYVWCVRGGQGDFTP